MDMTKSNGVERAHREYSMVNDFTDRAGTLESRRASLFKATLSISFRR